MFAMIFTPVFTRVNSQTVGGLTKYLFYIILPVSCVCYDTFRTLRFIFDNRLISIFLALNERGK